MLLDKKNKTIWDRRNRTRCSFWQLYNLFIGLLAGLAKGVGRLFVTDAFTFMANARVDKLSLLAWLNTLVLVDAVHIRCATRYFKCITVTTRRRSASLRGCFKSAVTHTGVESRRRVSLACLLRRAHVRARGLKSRYHTLTPSCVTTERDIDIAILFTSHADIHL